MPADHGSLMEAEKRRQEIIREAGYPPPRSTYRGRPRAPFQTDPSQEARTAIPSFTGLGYATANYDQLTNIGTLPSTSFGQPSARQDPVVTGQHQRHNINRLRPVPSRSFLRSAPTPTHHTRIFTTTETPSREQNRDDITAKVYPNFPNEQARPPSPSYYFGLSIVEPESTSIQYQDRSAQHQELHQSDYESDSSHVHSIRQTVGNEYQHNFRNQDRQRIAQTDSESDGDSDGAPDTAQVPNHKSGRSHVHSTRPTIYNIYQQNPRNKDKQRLVRLVPSDGDDDIDGYILRVPDYEFKPVSEGYQAATQFFQRVEPDPHHSEPSVVHKAKSWALDKVASRGDLLAGAVGLRLSKGGTRAECHDG
ncbi:hypothetical protein G6011_06937 [Alternaria panax]|uniref:Uncharacterized protein n=1 Tax=Alternaria panax TaxID=48097 RepID=A0AAD4I6N9_9PLEO|nr:hypothetical protein G6011_06937 [Alternaria panax]